MSSDSWPIESGEYTLEPAAGDGYLLETPACMVVFDTVMKMDDMYVCWRDGYPGTTIKVDPLPAQIEAHMDALTEDWL